MHDMHTLSSNDTALAWADHVGCQQDHCMHCCSCSTIFNNAAPQTQAPPNSTINEAAAAAASSIQKDMRQPPLAKHFITWAGHTAAAGKQAPKTKCNVCVQPQLQYHTKHAQMVQTTNKSSTKNTRICVARAKHPSSHPIAHDSQHSTISRPPAHDTCLPRQQQDSRHTKAKTALLQLSHVSLTSTTLQ